MASEPPSRDFLYAQIKSALREEQVAADRRIDTAALADRFRLSVTPIREVLHELIGERLVEVHPGGGFQLVTLDATTLAHLYAWNAQHMLAALHLLPEPVLRKVLAPVARNLAERPDQDPIPCTERMLETIAAATGNSEFIRQTAAANDRLFRARLAEAKLFPDRIQELRSLLKINGLNVRNNVRRRLLAIHRRRIEHAAQIAALLT